MSGSFRQERRRLLAQERVDYEYSELKSIVAATERGPLMDEQRAALDSAVDTLAHLERQVAGGAGIRDLRRILGWPSEKMRDVLGAADDANSHQGDDDSDEHRSQSGGEKKRKKRETGRRSASEYTAATVVPVEHESLQAKDHCPDPYCDGNVYPLLDPAKIIVVTGVAPLNATRYDLARLRCNLCGASYTAEAPAACGEGTYDKTVAAMIGLLRHGYGLPHYRIEKLGDSLGVPFPSSTQWDVLSDGADKLMPAFDELVRQAAQGHVITIDDTHMKVVALNAKLATAYEVTEEKVNASELPKSALEQQRTGVFTTGIVSTCDQRGEIVLFLTGEKHAGENFGDVLARRAAELEPPIRMADALSRNRVGHHDVLDAGCLVHGRRQFVDVAGSFPDEVEHVLEQLGLVYKYDDEARQAKMTADERLVHHQKHSKPVMDQLEDWMRQQIDERLVEPNSGLGAALAYFDDHWQRLTLFLREPGAPLDSNVVERAIKKSIRHRKNSLFYRSERGARVGDCYMSLVHTAERGGHNAFEYLVALIDNAKLVAASPADWMPWNYAATLSRAEPP